MKKKNTVIREKQVLVERHVSRRQFLYGAGSALMLPTLVSLMPDAVAQSVASEKKLRVCMLSTEYGIWRGWFTGEATNIQNMTTLNVATNVNIKHGLLSSIQGDVSYVLDSKCSPYKADMNVYKGLDTMAASGHHFGGYSGAFGSETRLIDSGRSIDVVIENSAAFKASFKGSVPTIRQGNNDTGLSFDRNRGSNRSFLSGEENCIQMGYELNDTVMFNNLFGSVSVAPALVNDANLSRRQLLVDKVLLDYGRLKNHRRISGNDINLLDQYMNSIFEAQSKLQVPVSSGMACSKPTNFKGQYVKKVGTRPDGSSYSYYDIDDINQYWKNVFTMVVAAFACDQTRIFCGHRRPDTTEHHDMDKSTPDYGGSRPQKEWMNLIVDHLIKPMKAQLDPFGGGSLLDNSIVLWHNEHAERTHVASDVPIMSFGKLGGRVNSGYFIDYNQPIVANKKSDFNIRRGFPMKMLLVSVMQAMGVTSAEINAEGDGNGYGSWTNGSLYVDSRGNSFNMGDLYDLDYFRTRHSTALPFFTKAG